MIFCIGEILADITADVRDDGTRRETFCAGGAPFNVACDIRALGGKAGFFGSTGSDKTGEMLKQEAERCGFDALFLRTSGRATTLAYVEISAGGERSFTFRADGTSDDDLSFDEAVKFLTENVAGSGDIVHFGSLMLRSDSGRKFAAEASEFARSRGALISFDVNLRQGLYSSASDALSASEILLGVSDIIKLSEEEAALITGVSDPRTAALSLAGSGKTVFVTLGSKGAYAARGNKIRYAPAVPAVAVDATGAGDAFFAAVLLSLSRSDDIEEALNAGVRSGGIAVTLKGSNLLKGRA